MTVSEARRLKELESENRWLKKLLAESLLEQEITREALRKMSIKRGSPSGNCSSKAQVGSADDRARTQRLTSLADGQDERRLAAVPTST